MRWLWLGEIVPDLGTHVIAGYWIKKYLCRTKRLFLIPLFLFGCILPDLIFKSGEVLFSYDYYWFFNAFHTPVSLLLQSLALAMLFTKEIRRVVFISIASGALLHLFLDATQVHVSGGNYFWLFPFSNFTAEIPLFSVDSWPYLLGVSVIILCPATRAIY
jgi:hypothetical protein